MFEQALPQPAVDPCSRTPDFAALVGAHAWRQLPQPVRNRFGHAGASANLVTYVGVMHTLRVNLVGRLFALLGRCFGMLFTPDPGTNVETIVRVSPADGGGHIWERDYRFSDRPPMIIRSTKVLDADGLLVEALGSGFCMKLKLLVEDGALHFVSDYYYLSVFGYRLQLPRWCAPGKCIVIHRDEGQGRFRFTMAVNHDVFGELYFQDGTFADP